MRIPDPLERIESSIGRQIERLDFIGDTCLCASCHKRINIDDALSLSERPDSPPICEDCAFGVDGKPGLYGK